MLSISGTCRVCLVHVDKKEKLLPACSTPVVEGMAIDTDTVEVKRSVVSNLKLIRCRHPNGCMTCEANGRCEFQSLVYKYQVEDILPHNLSEIEKKHEPLDLSSHALNRDMSKCVLCSRCIRACSEVQGMHILGMVGRGMEEHVSTVGDVPLAQTACISCGQCTAVCPAGALAEKLHIHDVEYGLSHKHKFDKIWVATTAPAVRVAISEEFDFAPGPVSTGKLVTALRELGFEYVFDTNFAADLPIVEEATEFLKRVKHGGPFPMFTSCCPGWINLAEKTYPQLLPQLSTCKSPQGMMGALIKTFFAEKIGVAPERIMHVSIMPCVAKKDEIARPQLQRAHVTSTGAIKVRCNLPTIRQILSLSLTLTLTLSSLGTDGLDRRRSPRRTLC